MCRAEFRARAQRLRALGAELLVLHALTPPVLQVRRILDVIRGRDYQQAVMMLEFLPHRAAKIVRARAARRRSRAPAASPYR